MKKFRFVLIFTLAGALVLTTLFFFAWSNSPNESTTTEFSATVSKIVPYGENTQKTLHIYTEEYINYWVVPPNVYSETPKSVFDTVQKGDKIDMNILTTFVDFVYPTSNPENVPDKWTPWTTIYSLKTQDQVIFSLDDYNRIIQAEQSSANITLLFMIAVLIIVATCCAIVLIKNKKKNNLGTSDVGKPSNTDEQQTY